MDSRNEAMLDEYRMTRSESLRNEIVLKNLGLVRAVALSMRNMYVKFGEVDDVVNEGVIALMEAIESYDPEKGAKFETYASLKIRGAIVDYIRKQDWVPRNVRKFARDLDNANSSLYNQYNREPTTAELAAHMEMSEDKLLKSMAEASTASTLSFEELLYEDNFEESSTGAEPMDAGILRDELKDMVIRAIEGLKEKEKQVITLYYYKNMKYSDIAKVIGVSESRVCQLHTQATSALKRVLEPYIKGGGAF